MPQNKKIPTKPASQWDAICDNPPLKAKVKQFTVRDGLVHAQTERMLTDRYVAMNIEGDSIKETEMMFVITNYPLLAAGVAEAEGFQIPMTEETFWSLPESFMNILVERIREVNPQYGIPFSELKKMIFGGFPSDSAMTPLDTSPSEKTDRDG